MKKFKKGEVIKINGRSFEITKVRDLTASIGTFELSGTLKGDPIFFAGMRTVFTLYLHEKPNGDGFLYSWDSK